MKSKDREIFSNWAKRNEKENENNFFTLCITAMFSFSSSVWTLFLINFFNSFTFYHLLSLVSFIIYHVPFNFFNSTPAQLKVFLKLPHTSLPSPSAFSSFCVLDINICAKEREQPHNKYYALSPSLSILLPPFPCLGYCSSALSALSVTARLLSSP